MKLKWVVLLLAAAVLAGCSPAAQSGATPLPTVVLGSGGVAPQATSQPGATEEAGPGESGLVALSGVTASGIVVPAAEAEIAAPVGGNVETVNVAVGDTVTAGQVLVRLAGSQKLAAAVDAARLELLAARQELDTLKENHDQDLATAQLRLAQAKIDLEDAQEHRQSMEYRRAGQTTINGLEADYIMAQRALQDAEDFYNGIGARAEDDPVRAQALSNLASAQSARDRALYNLNYATGLPDQNEIDKAEAQLRMAAAELALAQDEVERLADGPDPQQLDLAEARVKNASSQLDASQAALAELELKAPFSATVGKVNLHSGEWAAPGQVVLVLADLDPLRIQTTDLSERDVPGIQVGQPVTALVKALNQNVRGHVSEVSPLADTLGGDVVYQTMIELDETLPGLRAGMSVDVQFGAGE
ncbi:MAG: efflux RND transporter periplasmic adaptor subunit [Anaerolineaceae bacterium]|nr:efflux RND transporter periplasmic adaptor subunit [Anaerolineaceae bacterium]